MKNWLVALSGWSARAMAKVYCQFFSGVLLSSVMAGCVAALTTGPGRKPPPWITKPGMTRWNSRPL